MVRSVNQVQLTGGWCRDTLLGFKLQVQFFVQVHVFVRILRIPHAFRKDQAHEGCQRDPWRFSKGRDPVNPVFIGKKVSGKLVHLAFERALGFMQIGGLKFLYPSEYAPLFVLTMSW